MQAEAAADCSLSVPHLRRAPDRSTTAGTAVENVRWWIGCERLGAAREAAAGPGCVDDSCCWVDLGAGSDGSPPFAAG